MPAAQGMIFLRICEGQSFDGPSCMRQSFIERIYEMRTCKGRTYEKQTCKKQS